MPKFDFTKVIKVTDKNTDAKSVLLRVIDDLMSQSTPDEQLTLAKLRAKIDIEITF